MQGGKIVFKASQRTEISGAVSAGGTTGGHDSSTRNQVGIMDGATITANGIRGGGTVLVGGDAQGANPDVPNAKITYVAPTAAISADALQNGNGGMVVVWADNATQFGGNISARGGAVSGNGGRVEVSGKQWLGYYGLVNTTASHGNIGTLLLDPTDITISTAAGTGTMAWTAGSLSYADTTATPSNLNVTTLQNPVGSFKCNGGYNFHVARRGQHHGAKRHLVGQCQFADAECDRAGCHHYQYGCDHH